MKSTVFLNKGISLIELIIVMALIGTIMSMFFIIFYGNWISYNWEISQTEMQFQTRSAIDKIVKDVREAESVAIQNNNQKLILQTLGGNHTITYQLVDNQLTRSIDQGNAIILCGGVDLDNSNFEWRSGRAIFINISLYDNKRIFSHDSTTKYREVNLRSTVQRRNL